MHVNKKEHHFLNIENSTPRITQDWCLGGLHWGITHSPYSRPLLIANALTHTPYPWQLLIGPMEPLLINYCTDTEARKTKRPANDAEPPIMKVEATDLEEPWAELLLVEKSVILFGSQSSRWRKVLTLLEFGSFLKLLRVLDKSLPHPVGVFSMRPNHPKCKIRQKTRCFCNNN